MTATINKPNQINGLREYAGQIRLDTLELSAAYNNGHIAPAMSIVEILTVIYQSVMKQGDQFLLSKGHGCLSLYAVLRRMGCNPVISGHPDIDREQGIECTSGSLGHGLCIGVGKALAKKIKNEPGTIYVLMGDGECQEGSVWEALNIIKKHKLDNIVPIVDHNKLQALDTVRNILAEDNLHAKFEAFGFNVLSVDGNDVGQLLDAFETIGHADPGCRLILGHTVKGKGISFMENIPAWHTRMLNEEEYEIACREIRRDMAGEAGNA